MPRQCEECVGGGGGGRWEVGGVGRRGAASGKGGEMGGDRSRRDERYGDHPLQGRSIQKVVAMGGAGRRRVGSRDKHPIKQIKNNHRNYRPRTTGASPWTKNNTDSVQKVDTHWGRLGVDVFIV